MSEPDDRIFDWRLVKAGEVAPVKGGHGSWVETDHPAVVACMGSAPTCAANGCQREAADARVQALEAERDSYQRGCAEWNEKFEEWRQLANGNAAAAVAACEQFRLVTKRLVEKWREVENTRREHASKTVDPLEARIAWSFGRCADDLEGTIAALTEPRREEERE